MDTPIEQSELGSAGRPVGVLRHPDAQWIRQAVEHCAHDERRVPGDDSIGCQRESFRDLGLGWIYFGLVRACSFRSCLVIGSGRGFSAACMALALEHDPGARLLLVDPGYKTWDVDGRTTDIGAGLWSSLPDAAGYFRTYLGLSNIEVLPLRSDDAFARFIGEGRLFDCILVDGDHSFEQCLRDLRNAVACLAPRGFVLAHDALCSPWTGPARALDTLTLEDPSLDQITVPFYPGLGILQKRQKLIEIRLATDPENRQINEWRRDSHVTERPLPDGLDPRRGERRLDPREGLFAVLEGGNLIGGFGIYRRTFSRDGADDFVPHSGSPLNGFLLYGVVLSPQSRETGRWHLVWCQLARWFSEDGFYSITAYPYRLRGLPMEVQEVGRTPKHTAYHIALQPSGTHLPRHLPPLPLDRKSLYRHIDALQGIIEGKSRELALCQEEHRQSLADLQSIEQSKTWRYTRHLRALCARLRAIKSRATGTPL